jgi:serine/threonine-protein kinase HipA
MTRDGKVWLTPAYDILNTTLVLSAPKEEIALSVKGKKSKLDAGILIDYFGGRRLGLNLKSVASVVDDLVQAMAAWESLIEVSFLSDTMKTKYRQLLKVRSERLFV